MNVLTFFFFVILFLSANFPNMSINVGLMALAIAIFEKGDDE